MSSLNYEAKKNISEAISELLSYEFGELLIKKSGTALDISVTEKRRVQLTKI